MWHELVGYALNALDEEECAAMEAFLRESDDARRTLELIQERCVWLEAAREEHTAPAELAVRTCRYVRLQVEREPE